MSPVGIIGLSCANCGQIVQRGAEARGLAYATEVTMEAANQVGTTRGIVTLAMSVHRSNEGKAGGEMLLCDGCMGAALKATCESILQDMEDIGGQNEAARSH